MERERTMMRIVGSFLRHLWRKSDRDDALFLASGMAFNLLLCLAPILLLWTYVLGLWFQSSEATAFVDEILATAFPRQPMAKEIRLNISTALAEIVAHRTSFGLLSITVLIAASASLFSSTRTVLNRVFRIRSRHSLLISYTLDFSLVLALTTLILATTSLTWLYRGLRGMQGSLPPQFEMYIYAIPELVSIPLILFFCFLFYRYVPAQRVPRGAAFVAAATTSITWELSARIFAWYLSTLSGWTRTYGTYAFIIVLMLWVFYSSLIFVLGAEVGYVYQRAKRLRSRALEG